MTRQEVLGFAVGPNPYNTAAARMACRAVEIAITIECNPLLGPQLMTSVAEVVAGRPIAKRIVVEETMFTMDTAKQFIQTRKY